MGGPSPRAEVGTRKGRRRESDHVCISRRLRLAKNKSLGTPGWSSVNGAGRDPELGRAGGVGPYRWAEE